MIESIRLMDARDEGREEERKKTKAALKRAEAAEKRIIELEAQLAAGNQSWITGGQSEKGKHRASSFKCREF